MTSSSLEVLAALSLNDEEFEQHMAVKDNKEPPFYTQVHLVLLSDLN